MMLELERQNSVADPDDRLTVSETMSTLISMPLGSIKGGPAMLAYDGKAIPDRYGFASGGQNRHELADVRHIFEGYHIRDHRLGLCSGPFSKFSAAPKFVGHFVVAHWI